MTRVAASPSLAASVLVLNRFYMAVHVISVRRAFALLVRELAEVIHLEEGQYANYDFESWRELSDYRRTHFRPEHDDWVRTGNSEIQVPRVILILVVGRLVGEHQVQQVVVPDAVDQAAVPLATLLDESAALVGPDRARVERQHAQVDPMQAQDVEAVVEHQPGDLGPPAMTDVLGREEADGVPRLAVLRAQRVQEGHPHQPSLDLDHPRHARRVLEHPQRLAVPVLRLEVGHRPVGPALPEAALDVGVPSEGLARPRILRSHRSEDDPRTDDDRRLHGHQPARPTPALASRLRPVDA